MSSSDTQHVQIRYSKDNVPILSRTMLEEVVEQLITEHGYTPNSFSWRDLTTFFKLLQSQHNITLKIEDLGGLYNKKVLGAMDNDRNILYLDEAIMNHGAIYHFTFAHEIGHWALHRHRKVQITATDQRQYYADSEDNFISKEKLVSALDWLEWQANSFAGALLMPRHHFLRQVKSVSQTVLGNDHALLQGTADQASYKQSIYMLKDYFKVSQIAAQIRLKQVIEMLETST